MCKISVTYATTFKSTNAILGTMHGQQKKKVVIVGGGFGGVATAKSLAKQADLDVTLITKNSYFEYYPALYKLVTGALAIEVCVPYEKIFESTSVKVVLGEYTSLNSSEKQILLADGTTISYDYLVLALGSEINYFNIPGIEEFAYPFKSAEQALVLKQHFLSLFDQSKNISKEELVKKFHVTVVGGGPSGVELAGDTTTYLRKMARLYNIDPSFVTIDLIEASPRVLSMLPEGVSHLAEARLRKLKVNMYTNRTLQSQDLDTVTASGMTLRSSTVIWTAGTKINEGFNAFALDARKRVTVTENFSIPTDDTVFVVGDGASAQGTGLAQGAIKHGTYVASAIVAQSKGKGIAPYKGAVVGYVVPIGHNWAIFSYKKFTFSGFIPWLMRSAIDFNYFTTIVSFSYVLRIYRLGRKYRHHEL